MQHGKLDVRRHVARRRHGRDTRSGLLPEADVALALRRHDDVRAGRDASHVGVEGEASGAESDHGTGNVDQDVCWKCGGLHLAAECKATKQEKLAYKMKQMEKMKGGINQSLVIKI